jgi:branched-chain amino acid transport system substrate-binding protein
MRKRSKFLFIVIALIAMVVSPLFANGENEQKNDANTILIGGLYPLTGDLADSGQNMQKGIEMALEEINSAGGINGKTVEIIYGDTRGKGEYGMTEMERLITQKKVQAVIGSYQSSVTEVVAQVAETYQVPYITANATSDNLTSHDYDYFFRLAPTNMMFIRDMVNCISDMDSARDDINIKTIAVCADNTEVGQQTVEWTKYWAQEHGYEYLGEVLYSQGAADLTSEVLQLKRINPDALIVDCYVSDAILITKTFNEQGYSPKLVIAKGNGFTEGSYLPAVKNLSNGIAVATEFVEGAKGASVSEKFKEKYDIAMNGHSAEAYTTAYIVGTVLKMASDSGEITTKSIQKAFTEVKVDKAFNIGEKQEIILPYESISFTNSSFNGVEYKHQNMGGNLTVVQFKNEESVLIWPFNIAKVDFDFPAALK